MTLTVGHTGKSKTAVTDCISPHQPWASQWHTDALLFLGSQDLRSLEKQPLYQHATLSLQLTVLALLLYCHEVGLCHIGKKTHTVMHESATLYSTCTTPFSLMSCAPTPGAAYTLTSIPISSSQALSCSPIPISLHWRQRLECILKDRVTGSPEHAGGRTSLRVAMCTSILDPCGWRLPSRCVSHHIACLEFARFLSAVLLSSPLHSILLFSLRNRNTNYLKILQKFTAAILLSGKSPLIWEKKKRV